jgi:hypothetical protein
MLLLTSAICAICGTGAVPTRAQVAPEFRTGSEKLTSKTFARVRAEYGLVGSGRAGTTIADDLIERIEATEPVATVVTAKVRRPMELLDLDIYDHGALTQIDELARSTERQVGDILAALVDCRIEAGDARRMVMAVFRSYLDDLQAIPLR